MSTGQHAPPTNQQVERFAEYIRSVGRSGKPDRVPSAIRAEWKVLQDDDCSLCHSDAGDSIEGHLFKRHRAKLIAVEGRSKCFCSATGNCAFRVYLRQYGAYRQILDTDMVQSFAFLQSQTQDLPDLVIWCHDSAFERSAIFFRFDGHEYQASGGWEEDYESLDGDGLVRTKPRIISQFTSKDDIPKTNRH